MFKKPTEISVFNTTIIRSQNPFRVVIDGLVLKRGVAYERCHTMYKSLEGEDNRSDQVLPHYLVAQHVTEEDIEARLPSTLFSRHYLNDSTLKSSSVSPRVTSKNSDSSSGDPLISVEDYYCETGVLLPTERMVFVSGFIQRLGLRVVFVPACPEARKHVYITCMCNPYSFLTEIRSCIDRAFDYEKWYYPLKGVHVTMPGPFTLSDGSVFHHGKTYSYDPMIAAGFYPLGLEDIKAFMWLNKNKGAAYNQSQEKSMEDDNFATLFHLLSAKMKEYLDHYTRSLEGQEGGDVTKTGVFMRLSSRSPKDFIPQLHTASFTGEDVVIRIISSSRAFHCLKEYVGSRDPARVLHVIFLPWDEKYTDGRSYEFRCFAHHRKLTAISQYDCYTSFDLLQSPTITLYFRDRIFDFHKQIRNSIPLPSYVMDVAFKPASEEERGRELTTREVEALTTTTSLGGLVSPSSTMASQLEVHLSTKYECHLIEFNPFYGDMSSGAALFDWKRDRELLYEERPKPIIRVRIKTMGCRYSQNKPTVLDLL
eukprot:TRINITY_DN11636_c1_g1_i3.p1 TRINITY_DN11636_c1_g1~~TRINITY_DN11636_c1_g1_i3.p1  ORF type:complete len:537 (+),score=45.18 TRINITY_DN11636_c1_g1_i3:93-1703(+)